MYTNTYEYQHFTIIQTWLVFEWKTYFASNIRHLKKELCLPFLWPPAWHSFIHINLYFIFLKFYFCNSLIMKTRHRDSRTYLFYAEIFSHIIMTALCVFRCCIRRKLIVMCVYYWNRIQNLGCSAQTKSKLLHIPWRKIWRK